MASVRVLVDDLERGDLPALSAKTGVACANPVAIVLRPEARPFSPLGRKINAIVPLEPARARTRRLMTRVTWALLVAVAACVVAAITGAGSAVLLLGALLLILYVALVRLGELRWIGAKSSDDKGEITLTRVHREFARAVDEQYSR